MHSKVKVLTIHKHLYIMFPKNMFLIRKQSLMK